MQFVKRQNEESEGRHVLAPVRYPVGGIRSFIRYVYSAMQDEGYRFTLLGPEDSLFQEFRRQLSDWQGMEFCSAPVEGKRWLVRRTMRSLLKSGRFSMIHSHGLTAGIQAAIANLGVGIPHVLSSHGLVSPRDFLGMKGKMRRVAMDVLLRSVDKVVAESNDARENHLAHFRSLRRPGRTVTIFNGIVPPSTNGQAGDTGSDLHKELKLDDETYLIGFFGRFMPEKGFPVLADAIRKLAETPEVPAFHLVTTGDDDYVREYKRDIASYPEVTRRIAFLGQVPDLGPVLRQMDLIVTPSLWEACPLLPMEAMVAGVPVLGSDCVGLREVLHDTPSRMVPSNDASALAEGIINAMRYPWTEKAAAFVRTAKERFDVRNTAEQLCSLCDEVVYRGNT